MHANDGCFPDASMRDGGDVGVRWGGVYTWVWGFFSTMVRLAAAERLGGAGAGDALGERFSASWAGTSSPSSSPGEIDERTLLRCMSQ